MTKWKLVPCEATEEMERAAEPHLMGTISTTSWEDAQNTWRAMVQAAPASPVTEEMVARVIEDYANRFEAAEYASQRPLIIDEAARAVMALFLGEDQ